MSDPTPLLEVRDLHKQYSGVGGAPVHVLRGVSMNVSRGETVAVVGDSGSGKSTLLHLLGALDRPDEGSVRFGGEDVFARKDLDLARFRNRSVGFVFQFHHLLPEFSAAENVAMPALIGGMSMQRALRGAHELLDRVGLADRADHRPAELSGGEQQRIAVVRALMNDPDLVLADEPTGNLDEKTGAVLQDLLLDLSRSMQKTFVIVTHSTSFAAQADRTLRLESGVLHAGA